MSEKIQEMIAGYERGIQVFTEAARNAPRDLLDRHPAQGKWSIRQIVAHMADVEVVTAARIRWFAAQPGSRLVAWDQDIWADKLGYDRQPFEEALQAFIAVRTYTAQMLRNLPETAWHNTAFHEERGDQTLLVFMEYQVEHPLRHAGQILDICRRFSAPPA
jgi:uncharacterized damage-inducible protein DinB